MSAKIIGLFNLKGGVGKTSTAVNLAWSAARIGSWKVLLWDLDAQAASSYMMGSDPRRHGGTRKLVSGKLEVSELIVHSTCANLDLIPAHESLWRMDLALDAQKKPNEAVRQVLKPILDSYQYIFLDCPPGLSLLAKSVLHAADIILVPVVPSALSLRTLDGIVGMFKDEDIEPKKLQPFISMMDGRKKQHRSGEESVRAQWPGTLVTIVPQLAEIERSGNPPRPSASVPGSRAEAIYSTLWEEIRAKIAG